MNIQKKNLLSGLSSMFALSLGLTFLLFITIWTQHPGEIFASKELNQVKYIYIGVFGGFTFFLLFLLGLKKIAPNICANTWELITLLIGLSISILVFKQFLRYSDKNYDWWLNQSSWFYRENGISMGILAAFMVFMSCLITLKYLKLMASEENSINKKFTALLIIFSFAQYALFNYFLDPYGLYPIFLTIIVELLILVMIKSIVFIDDRFIIRENSNQPSQETPSANQEPESHSEIYHRESNANSEMALKLKRNGHLKWLLVFLIAQIIYISISVKSDQSSENAGLMILPFIGGVLLINYWSIGKKVKVFKFKVETPPREEISLSFHLKHFIYDIFLTFVKIIRPVAVLVMLTGLWYGFTNGLYLPKFHVSLSLWAMIGCVVFFLLRKEPNISRLVYVAFIGAIFWLIFKINDDVILNAYSYYDRSFYTIYPFQVLLSGIHAAIIGLASGFILSYETRRILFHYLDSKNIQIRAMILPIFWILMGVLVVSLSIQSVPGGYIVGYPGAYNTWEHTINSSEFLESSYLGSFISICILTTILLYHWMIIPIMKNIPGFGDKLRFTSWKNDVSAFIMKESSHAKQGMIAVGLAILIFLPTIFFVNENQTLESVRLDLVSNQNGVSVYAGPSNIRIASQQVIQPATNDPVDAYRLQMAKNEYESMQLIITPNDRSLNGLQYSISSFYSEDLNETLPSDIISIEYAENIYETMPDKLIPFEVLHLIEQRNHVFWITAKTPYSMTAGSYTGNISFTFGNEESFNLRLTLDVWNFTLPNTRHFRSNFGPQTTNSQHINSFLDHHINSYGIPVSWASTYEILSSQEQYTCWYNNSAQDWVFNWTWWDAQTGYAINNGQNGFYINCPLGMPREPKWVNNDDPNNISTWGQNTAKFYAGVQDHFEYLRDFEGKDWFPYLYIYFIDEFQMFIPDGYEADQYWALLEVFLALIDAAAPDIRIMTTSPPTQELAGIGQYIDIYCPISSDYDEIEWQAAKDAGKEIWMYACVGPRTPWPNSHAYNRLYEIRVLYWQSWYYGLDGFLYWSTNPYYHGSYGWGYNSWGDAWYVYMDEDDNVYDGIRWDNFRDAAEDYEYLWLLNATGSILNNVSINDELSIIVQSVSTDRYNYCDSAYDVRYARNLIGASLSQLWSDTQQDLLAESENLWTGFL